MKVVPQSRDCVPRNPKKGPSRKRKTTTLFEAIRSLRGGRDSGIGLRIKQKYLDGATKKKETYKYYVMITIK
jgi:hypothetical protein